MAKKIRIINKVGELYYLSNSSIIFEDGGKITDVRYVLTDNYSKAYVITTDKELNGIIDVLSKTTSLNECVIDYVAIGPIEAFKGETINPLNNIASLIEHSLYDPKANADKIINIETVNALRDVIKKIDNVKFKI